jgi:hypothetical protein
MFYVFFLSFVITFAINPGIPERKYYSRNKDKKNYSKCKKCNILAPTELNIGHCIDCDICIEGHDHHCSWVGKCIGKRNIIFFYFFIAGFLGFIITLLYITLITFVKFSKKNA